MTEIVNQPLKIIIDTNAFFVPLQCKIDIFNELDKIVTKTYVPILISPVKKELVTLIKQESTQKSKEATFALSLSEKCKFIKVVGKSKETTDDVILRIAKQWNAPVLTNDKLLKKRLRDISMPVIYVRAKSRLEIDGMI
ncbi:MAG: DNA-binding protein [Crenarchaeota archaeon]|nr:DNA-binding protein [Thermoproteota archaeon]